MPMLSWDDLRLFLAVTRAGRLTLAGRAEGIDHTTIARRVAKLEGALGTRLFDRSPRGVTLTEAGRMLRGHAEAMERAVEDASAAIGGRDVAVAGMVRMATPETFGTALVAPNVAGFHSRHPALTLELLPESRAVSLANREADVAIVLTPPSRGRLVTRRLTDYSLGLYASRTYLDQHGPILAAGDLGRHAFAGYIDAMLDLPQLAYLQELGDLPVPAFRSTSSAAQYAAVSSGLGLALLHDFVARKDENLVPVLGQVVRVLRTYWLVVHEELQHVPRVRAAIDFLDAIVAQHRNNFNQTCDRYEAMPSIERCAPFGPARSAQLR